MSFTTILRRTAATGAIVLVCLLYLADLTGMGLFGPDEPRYAAIGQAMARTGDWITPRLWGVPWFEKPALLYWMTATGFRLGLGADLAPRLPLAMVSLAFLRFFWWRVRIEWDFRVASLSTALLATSAGWLAYSHVAVTDLPLAVFFSTAVLFALQGRPNYTAAAGCLGLAALAKGLVPLILFLPVLATDWRRWRLWLRPGPLLAFAICALPWYILCTLRNGREFLRVFFVQQQFTRFTTTALRHGQPWWFYIPVALLLLYPWFPLLVYAGRGWQDTRVRTLAAVTVFGFLFFSASVNKLPGYLLPLLPLVCVLMGIGLAHSQTRKAAAIATIALLAPLPLLPRVVSAALSHGLRSAIIPWKAILVSTAVGAFAGAIIAFAARKHALQIAVALAGLGFLWFQITTFPALDIAASARPIWRASQPPCATGISRSLLYGLNYYAGRPLPNCGLLDPNGTGSVR